MTILTRNAVLTVQTLLMASLLGLLAASARAQPAGDAEASVTLTVGGRAIHTFRAPLGEFSAAERAEGARQRIERALQSGGEGWTSVRQTTEGPRVELDGRPMFTVVAGDATGARAGAMQDAADAASRTLQKIWAEAQETRAPGAAMRASGRTALAALALAASLAVLTWLGLHLPGAMAGWLRRQLAPLQRESVPERVGSLLPAVAHKLVLLLLWLMSLAACVVFASFALHQFAATRAAGEALADSLSGLLGGAVHAIADAIPGMVVAALIFLTAWVFAQIRLSSSTM
jgi:hypothetical protein